MRARLLDVIVSRASAQTAARLLAPLDSCAIIGKSAFVEFAAVIAALLVLAGQPSHGAVGLCGHLRQM